MKIYDCFIYYNETDILSLRVDLLRDYVDCFVIARGLQNHRGQPNTNSFPVLDYGDTDCELITVDLPDYGNDDYAASQRENFQRDALLWGLQDVKPDDLILFGDVDEIPDPRALQRIIDSTAYAPVKLQQYLSYYAPNYRTSTWWYGTTAARRRDFKRMTELRNRTIDNTMYVNAAGWHMSYCGDVDFIQTKLSDFCHADLCAPWNNRENIEQSLQTGKNLFDRNEHFTRIETDDTFPENMHKFSYLLK